MKRIKGVIPLVLIASLIGLSNQSFSNVSQAQVGRYLTVNQAARNSQSNPLEQTFMLTIPESINTIGGAISYILANTGYKLQPKQYQTIQVGLLLGQPLPLSDRKLGPMTVMQALSALSDHSFWQILLDPNHRYVSFILRPSTQSLYDQN